MKENAGRRLLAALLAVVCLSGCGVSAVSEAKTAAEYIAQGGRQVEDKDFSGAEKSYRQALVQEPGSEEAARGLISALSGDGQDKAALAQAYEALYDIGTFTNADYETLAGLYGELGETVKQRSTLEKRYRLAPDEVSLALLEAVVADPAQDDGAVQQEFSSVERALTDGDDAAVISLLTSSEWASALAPQANMGYRRWRSEAGNKTPLRIEVGLDGAGSAYTRLWFGETGVVRCYAVAASQALAAQLVRANGTYTGAFTCVSCDASSGTVYQDAGTLTNGLLTGSYTSAVGVGQATSLSELFSAADSMEKIHYSGTFSNEGISAEKQQTAVTGENGAVYAYNADNTKFLYLTFADGTTADTAIFDSSKLGIPAFPEW